MAAPKKLKSSTPRFNPETAVGMEGPNGTHAVTDDTGVLWRIDPLEGTMRRVVIEKPKKASRKKR